MRCDAHPQVETNLCCGKCGKPICPKCMVHTPVGARCRECARVSKLPTFQVSLKNYLIAAGVGLGMATAAGIAWGVAGWALALFFHLNLNLILAPGVGYTIGEVMSLSVNRRRGRGLAVLAGFFVVISYLVATFFPWGLSFSLSNLLFPILDLIALALGIFIAINRLR